MPVDLYRPLLVFAHVLLFSGASALIAWTYYRSVKGATAGPTLSTLAYTVVTLFLFFWTVSLLIVFFDTGFDTGKLSHNPALVKKVLWVSGLTLTGLLLYLFSNYKLNRIEYLSRSQSVVLCIICTVSLINWSLAGLIGSGHFLIQFSVPRLVAGYLSVITLACLITLMLSQSIHHRLNLIRARAAIAELGLTPTLTDTSRETSRAQSSLHKSFNVSILIIKLVIPFFIISEVLHYLGYIEYIAFLFEPITNLLSLPPAVAIAFAAAFFLNIYAGIAVAAGLSLSPYEWTIVGTFIAICHSIPLEAAVMKKVGFSIHLHWISRLALALFGAWIAAVTIPQELAADAAEAFVSPVYSNFMEMLIAAIQSSIVLTVKVIVLVTALVIGFDIMRKIPAINTLMDKHTYLSSLTVGGLLGITYGAGILLKDIESVDKNHKMYLLVFLLLAHGLIEETLIFAFFGADIAAIFLIRVGIALIAVFSLYLFTKSLLKRQADSI